MNVQQAISQLRANEQELRAMGFAALSLFGSTARGEAGPRSDIDLAVMFDPARKIDMFEFAAIGARLEDVLGAPVDLVTEPARKPRLQAEIERDRIRVF
jgi:uncharacterized protein